MTQFSENLYPGLGNDDKVPYRLLFQRCLQIHNSFAKQNTLISSEFNSKRLNNIDIAVRLDSIKCDITRISSKEVVFNNFFEQKQLLHYRLNQFSQNLKFLLYLVKEASFELNTKHNIYVKCFQLKQELIILQKMLEKIVCLNGVYANELLHCRKKLEKTVEKRKKVQVDYQSFTRNSDIAHENMLLSKEVLYNIKQNLRNLQLQKKDISSCLAKLIHEIEIQDHNTVQTQNINVELKTTKEKLVLKKCAVEKCNVLKTAKSSDLKKKASLVYALELKMALTNRRRELFEQNSLCLQLDCSVQVKSIMVLELKENLFVLRSTNRENDNIIQELNEKMKFMNEISVALLKEANALILITRQLGQSISNCKVNSIGDEYGTKEHAVLDFSSNLNSYNTSSPEKFVCNKIQYSNSSFNLSIAVDSLSEKKIYESACEEIPFIATADSCEPDVSFINFASNCLVTSTPLIQRHSTAFDF